MKEGLFFSQAAVVTFGGAYSVLAYIGQQAVEQFGWLQPGEMLDGLGHGETTPGPLIRWCSSSASGAYRNPGPFTPLTAGILGSCDHGLGDVRPLLLLDLPRGPTSSGCAAIDC